MARDFATVFGFTGLITSTPAFIAVTIGEHPVACAENTFVLTASINPISFISLKLFQIFVSNEPLAQGTTTASGAFHPSCSTISYPWVFDPSA